MTFSELRLSVRQGDVAGGLRAEVEVEAAPERDAHWLVFVHGFNVPRRQADDQWAVIRERLELLDLGVRVCAGPFLWPSDPLANSILSKATYPVARPVAHKSGRKLGRYLRQQRPPHVVLVGHSLGAVVALQAIQTMIAVHRPDSGVALLAPAVRDLDLYLDGEYWDKELRAVREAVTYSPTDGTLRGVFRPGEKGSTPFEPVGDAVGLYGRPLDRPWVSRVDVGSNDHGHWKIDRAYAAVLAAVGEGARDIGGCPVPERDEMAWAAPD